MTPNVSRGYELADLIKRGYIQNLQLYSAGYIRLLLPNEVLGRLSIDLVVRGEAEPVIEEIINRHRDGAEFKDILSCSYRDNGNIVHKPIAPLIDINIFA